MLSRLQEARHPVCDRLRAARLLPSDNGVFRVALARAEDLNALAGIEARLGVVLEDLVKRPVHVVFQGPDDPDDSPDAPGSAGATLTALSGARAPTAGSRPAGAAPADTTRRARIGSIVTQADVEREIGARLMALGGIGNASAGPVFMYLRGLVVTADGWTMPVSHGDIARGINDINNSPVTSRTTVSRAINAIHRAGLILAVSDEDESQRRSYQLYGCGYQPVGCATSAHPPQKSRTSPQGGCATSAHHLNHVVVVDSLDSETQQQQDSGDVRLPHTCAASAQGDVRLPHTHLDPAALDPDRRLAHHWLAGYRIVGPTLLELLGADPERVIGLLLEVERDRRAGQVADAHATGRLVTLLREDAQPWALTRRFVRHVRQTGEAPLVGEIDLLDGDFDRLLDDMLRGLRLFAHSDPARYTSGEYADYIES